MDPIALVFAGTFAASLEKRVRAHLTQPCAVGVADVLITPHVSGWTDGMMEARARTIASNIARVARGEPPLNKVSS